MSVLVLIIFLAKRDLMLINKPDVGELADYTTIHKIDLMSIGADNRSPHLVHYVYKEGSRGAKSMRVIRIAAIRGKTPLAVTSGNLVIDEGEPAKADYDVTGWCVPLAYDEPFKVDGATVGVLFHAPLFVQKLIG